MFPQVTWSIPNTGKTIFLTFDDGPVPDVSPFVLQTLDAFDAKATFFCVGSNVEKNPKLFQDVVRAGHAVGNHTHSHVNGWKTHADDYVKDVERCAKVVKSTLFRPPYGRITPTQVRRLKTEYSICMWSVLSYDFDANVHQDRCLKNLIRATDSGDIVVFHDSIKAFPKMKYMLPRMLDHFSEKGYVFKSLMA